MISSDMHKYMGDAGNIINLRNEALEVSVLQNVGAKLMGLVHRGSGHDFLWHNPRIKPQRYAVEANFDNYWCGGWDDGFPTCETCVYQGEVYPNLGELRSLAWDIESIQTAGTEPSVKLSAHGPISPVRAEKTIRLRGDSLEICFVVEHTGHLPIDFIWGTHPAYAIADGCVLHIPGKTGIVGQANHPLLGVAGQRYEWPILNTGDSCFNMSRVPAPGEMSSGHYVTDLFAGWYALEYPDRELGLLFEFPLELCPYLWLWLSYGGWRGHYVAVIEPWTSHPVTLSDAVAAKTHRVLAVGEKFTCSVRATPWQGSAMLDRLLKSRGIEESWSQHRIV